jgi:hypothetical protein
MRSIASQHREDAKSHPHESLVSRYQSEGDDLEEMDYPDPGPNPEEIALKGEEEDPIDAIQAQFAADYEAQLLIEGWCDGLRGKPLRELTGLDQAALDYKAKLIRRRIKALYPQGWTT